MRISSRTARIAAAAALTAGLVGLGAPAQAERYSIDDPADASGSLNDIYGLTVNHGLKKVKFAIRVDDLRRVSSAGATLFFNTDPDDPGPEYALATGLSSGTDYALLRVEGWRGAGSGPLNCNYDLALDYRDDVVRGYVSRGCLKKPATVAAAVKMVDAADSSHLIRDWAPATRTFGLPIAPG
jgi:hypothetical protein